MPMTANIPVFTEYQTGWSVAAIRDNEVFAIVSLDVGKASEITSEMTRAATDSVLNMQSVKSATEAADAAWGAIEDSDDPERAEEDWNRIDISVRFGMASGGEFCHNFSKAEAKRAGIARL